MSNNINPKQVGKWVGLSVLVLGVIWIVFSLLKSKSFESIGIGLIISILGVAVLLIFKKLG